MSIEQLTSTIQSGGGLEAIKTFALVHLEPRVDGTTSYDHAERILSILESVGGFPISDGFRMAVYIHDILFDRKSRREKAVELANGDRYNPDLLSEIYALYQNNDDITTRANLAYAIGIAQSANEYERDGEQWRQAFQAACQPNPDASFAFLDAQFAEIALKLNGEQGAAEGEATIAQYKAEVIKGISSGASPVTEAMLALHSPMADLDSMVQTLGRLDIEGLLLKTAEVIDNITYPNTRRPASTWRDAQELLSFYSPMLKLAGFDDFAMEASSRALSYLNKDRPSLDVAKGLYEASKTYAARFADPIRTILKLIGGEGSYTRFRVKTTGSSVEKLEGADKFNGTNPDNLGFTLVIPDPPEGTDLKSYLTEYIRGILETIPAVTGIYNPITRETLRAVPGHTRPKNPTVEVNFGTIAKSAETIMVFDDENEQYSVSWDSARPNTYQAVHIVFRIPPEIGALLGIDISTPVGLEVQITTKSADIKNTHGSAHSVFRKAHDAFGKLGNFLRRRGESAPDPAVVESRKLEIYEELDYIFARAESFKQRAVNATELLTPSAMQQVLAILPYIDEELIHRVCPQYLAA